MTARQRLRQQQLLRLAANGKNYTQAGRILHIAPETVRKNMARTVRDLGARNVAHAVIIALRAGIISPDDIEIPRGHVLRGEKTDMNETRLLVTGPRTVHDPKIVTDVLHEAVAQTTGPVILVHGHCPGGVDAIADRWGHENGKLLLITVERHPAQRHPTQDFGPWPWAGPKRNEYMVSLGAERCIAFMAPCDRYHCVKPKPHYSHSTSNCAMYADRAGITVERHYL